jgi:hypothetical protein
MSARDWFRVLAKEFRALGPAWALCAVAVLGAWTPDTRLRGLAIAAFFFGAPALGALSIGHEFNYGTMSMLLTQPVRRRQLLLAKQLVLAVFLLALAILIRIFDIRSVLDELGRAALWMPVMLGFLVAPWLTTVTRRPVAGAVFSCAIPGTLLVLGQLVGNSVFGDARHTDVDAFRTWVVWTGTLTACVAGALFGVRAFTHLQVAGEGSGEDRAAPRSTVRASARTAPRRADPTWVLVRKELRLQQLPLAIALFWLAAYVIAYLTTRSLGYFSAATGVITVFYGGILAVIAGAVASAEERQFGTLDSQLLLPIGVARQWLVKIAVTLAIALLLGYVMPRLVMAALPASVGPRHDDGLSPLFGVAVVLFAVGGLYLSTVCTNPLWAVILAFPTFVVIGSALKFLGDTLNRMDLGLIDVATARSLLWPYRFDEFAGVLFAAGLATLVLRLARTNHQFVDRSATRIALHAGALLAAMTLGMSALAALRAL